MADQAQCPNCGGYKVTQAEKAINKEEIYPVRWWDRLIALILISATGGLILLFSSQLGSMLFGKRVTFETKIGTTNHFTCRLCGYEWDWNYGEPWPEVSVRSDLIAKGAQKLAEYEAAERQRQEAAWYLEQQRKK